MRNFGIHFAPVSSGFRGANAAAGEPRQPQVPAAANIMSGSAGLGGKSTGRPAYSAKQYYRADLLTSFPAGSILKPSNTIDALAEVSPTLAVAQATIDFLKVFFAILTVVVTGAGIAIAAFYFLFC